MYWIGINVFYCSFLVIYPCVFLVCILFAFVLDSKSVCLDVALVWTTVGYIVSSIKEPRVGQLGTMSSTTWSLVPLPQQVFQSQSNLSGCPEQTGSDRMV